MSIARNIQELKAVLPPTAKLVAVSKTKPNEAVLEAYAAGQRIFGENYIQELQLKENALPKDIQWHFIGHLQSNKVKYIAPYIALIHGIDSLKLLVEVNKQAQKSERIVPCLLQVHIATEESKFGLSEDELDEMLNSTELAQLHHVKIVGLMGMASFSNNLTLVENEFKTLKALFDKYSVLVTNNIQFSELSMGMSGDYEIALKHGATLVRIGSSIFGTRS